MPAALKSENVDIHTLLNNTEDIKSLKGDIVEFIKSGQFGIVSLVEFLGPFLTNKDETKRVEGTALLADVLFDFPSDYLSPLECNVIGIFFCDRLKDHFTVIPATIKGLLAVVSMTSFPKHLVLELLVELMNNVKCQSLSRQTRYNYYELLQVLMINGKDELMTKPGDYVYACVSAMESEGDPRNLMFLFHFLPEVFQNFPFKHLAEEVFNVLECYFPIDFNSREDSGITRADLAAGLENCLTATIEFGPFAFPMIFEKLESALKIAHVDSYKLLIKGFKMWSVDDINPHIMDVWKYIKTAIFPSSDAELSDLAIKVVVAVFHKYETSPINKVQTESLRLLLREVTSSSYSYLGDSTTSLFFTSSKLLAGISLVSSTACDHIVKTALNNLVARITDLPPSDTAFQTLSMILQGTVQHCCWNKGSTEQALKDIPSLFIGKLRNPLFQRGCFLCLGDIISVLDPGARQIIYETILQICVEDLTTNESFRCFLTLLAEKYSDEVKNQVLHKLNVTEIEDVEVKKRKMELLCWCLDVESLVLYAVNEILSLILHDPSTSAAVLCFRVQCERISNCKILYMLSVECHVVEKLLEFYLKRESMDNENVINASKIIELVMRNLSSSEQNELLGECLKLFPQFSEVSSLPSSGPQTNYFNLSNTVLLKGLLIPLKQQVQVSNCAHLVTKLLNSSLFEADPFHRECSMILLASIINKYHNENELQEILVTTFLLINNSLSEPDGVRAVALLSWITKSLILKGHRQSDVWLEKLIQLLEVDTLQTEAAEGFKLILMDLDELSVKNNCIYRLLFKQRIFCKVKNLMTFLEKNTGKTRIAISMSIAYILQSVPTSLVVGDSKELIKTIIICMESEDSRVVSVILDVISGLFETDGSVFEEYVESFIPRCLNCCRSSKMVVRIRALTCLYYCGKFREIKILPFRNMVLEGVLQCIDDKKRLVRHKAVEVRTRWFLVGSKED